MPLLYLVHERQRLLHIFLLLCGQILEHLLQLILVICHFTIITYNNKRESSSASQVNPPDKCNNVTRERVCTDEGAD